MCFENKQLARAARQREPGAEILVLSAEIRAGLHESRYLSEVPLIQSRRLPIPPSQFIGNEYVISLTGGLDSRPQPIPAIRIDSSIQMDRNRTSV
jgi:hypothetical protein